MFGLITVGVGCESLLGDFANGGFIPWGFGPYVKGHLDCPRGKNVINRMDFILIAPDLTHIRKRSLPFP
jgi:hypothetical protein